MTNEEIKQNALIYATDNYGEYNEHDYTDHYHNNLCNAVSENAFIAGAHNCDWEIEMLQNQIEELSEQLKMNAENIQKLRKPWISVEDRLPHDGDYDKENIYCFLVRQKCGFIYNCAFDREEWITVAPDGEEWGVDGVTHWMPIQKV